MRHARGRPGGGASRLGEGIGGRVARHTGGVVRGAGRPRTVGVPGCASLQSGQPLRRAPLVERLRCSRCGARPTLGARALRAER